ncbi:MAG: hypothetical protein WCG27_09980, partial [Pseudomonadota bacterium]
SVLQIGAYTRFRIPQVKGLIKKTSVFDLVNGQIRALFPAGSDSVIRTPKVAVGIRGTELLVDVLKVKKNKTEVEQINRVGLLKGSIEVTQGSKTWPLNPLEYYSAATGKTEKIPASDLKILAISQNRFLNDVVPVPGQVIEKNERFNELRGQLGIPEPTPTPRTEVPDTSVQMAKPASGAPQGQGQLLKQKVEKALEKGVERNEKAGGQ